MKNPEFKVHILNEKGIQEAENIAASFDNLLEFLKERCLVNSREFSLVKTKLEEASFFAKKSMAIHPDNQK